ncbi:MAG: hypothetical protein RLZZ182_2083 [Pseudomonadota bacterium]|jgi:hypothetical protein
MFGRTAAPVTWKALIITALVLVLLMSAVAAAAGWWAWRHMAARVTLQNQPALVRLPDSLAVEAEVSRAVKVKVDQVLPVSVPIDEHVSIPFPEPVPVKVHVEAQVPVSIDVPFEHVFAIDQTIDLDTTVRTKVLGFSVNVPIKGQVPLKAQVPVKLVVPVRHTLPVSLDVPAQVRLPEPIRAHVQTTVKAQIPIRESLTLPVTEPVQATLRFPNQEVKVSLVHTDVLLPFDTITVAPTSGWASLVPEAMRPWGQRAVRALPPGVAASAASALDRLDLIEVRP